MHGCDTQMNLTLLLSLLPQTCLLKTLFAKDLFAVCKFSRMQT